MFLNVSWMCFYREGSMVLKTIHFFQSHRHHILLIILTGMIYWMSIAFKPYLGSFILKWLPIGLLILLTWHHRQRAHVKWLFLGLAFHSIGDVIIDFEGDFSLLVAIFPFMIGHLSYAYTFYQDRRKFTKLATWEKAFIVFIILYGVAFSTILSTHLPLHFFIAVNMYIVIILGMVILSMVADYPEKLVLVGALLYVISDSLIAVDAFVLSLPWSPFLTWPTYLLGQLFITIGYLSEKTVMVST